MINIQEKLWAPCSEKLTHPKKVNGGLEVRFGFAEGHSRIIVFQLFESNEQLRGDIIEVVKERVHKLFGNFVVE